MKKLFFSTIIALVMVISGVAGVSAFEAHQVDINAHVENAIGVSTDNLDLGNLFPEQTVENNVEFGLSQSFMAQTTYKSVNYALYWQLKPSDEIPGVTPAPLYTVGGNSYYEPLNPFLTTTLSNNTGSIDENTVNVAPTSDTPEQFATGTLSVGTNLTQNESVHFIFNAPVFQGYYNSGTDPISNWNYMLKDGQFVNSSETLSDGTPVTVPNADLGINMIIQVTGINSGD